MLKKDLRIRLDQYGRVILDDAELATMIAAEDTDSLAGGVGWNDPCNNDDNQCGGSFNTICANLPGYCGDSLNVDCNPNEMIK